ncbi:methionine synthase [Candidatus Desantisbacteria bacterium CG1_02_38_46]|uniref:Methionine synthase n=3 Tax=unclassified Candidatus Desantisiibacteriota TaxID=3106372 RepID=A0A2H9PA53_9BACT|nr:MAG: methionine synthase [Candidatus Desantisbacteria bacterium CG1_02_38_46]PIU52162.1 MAG: methionine synthase [Candidatus Desantisbacteria bacterium CG07_land_8_20_14_0_80_39_15]PIZ15250.1 MAG: methionine synthase [Candidatus Desantisbacteria bacterium CG_4_10_14_0_8_um_filter_39_17]
MKVIGVSLGTCIHVAGLLNFLKLCEAEGYSSSFLGSAVSPERLIEAIKKERPDLVAISYRLDPSVAERLFEEVKKRLEKNNISDVRFVFGGTAPVAEIAKKSGLFECVFDGTQSIDEIRAYLKGESVKRTEEKFPQDLVSRIEKSYPYPILRHHFGLPSLKETVKGARKIARAQVLDVLSLGPDQNAQESFFRPDEMKPGQDGAGGVPLRKPGDLRQIHKATRCANHPLLRCYSGTRDLVKWAKMLKETINIAWGAVPLCWYSLLDGRSTRPLEEAIRENQKAIRWYASQEIPVEVNESHQWSLRDAHDSLAVAMAFLAAYNAKNLGVRYYVSQYMFNTPPGTSPVMDLGKMLAKIELIESLHDENFTTFRQVRAGLASFLPDLNIAKGQLAASGLLSLALKPHILHVVGYCEAHHIVTPVELIESCKIIHGMIHISLQDFPDLLNDKRIQKRKKELIIEANVLLDALGKGKSEPLCNPEVLTQAIEQGLLDAPHLKNNPHAKGRVITRMIEGKCCAVDGSTGKVISEKERIELLKEKKK